MSLDQMEDSLASWQIKNQKNIAAWSNETTAFIQEEKK